MIYGTWENSQILGQIKKFYAKLGYFWQHPSSILGNFLLHIRKFLPKKQDPGRKNTFSIYASGYGGGVGVEFTLFCLGLSWWRRKFKVVQDQSSEEDWSEKDQSCTPLVLFRSIFYPTEEDWSQNLISVAFSWQIVLFVSFQKIFVKKI